MFMRMPVTRARALRAAMKLADSAGLESLSMRKLATELGVEAMSLYYHVANKEDILDGMVDLVFDEVSLPRTDVGWRDAMRQVAVSTRTVLGEHPWAIGLLDSRASPGMIRLAHLDAVIGCLRNAGFSLAMAAHAMATLDSYVRGFAMQEHVLPSNKGDITETAEAIMTQQKEFASRFPHLAEMATGLILQPGYAFGDEFGWGLELILDAVEDRQGRARPQ